MKTSNELTQERLKSIIDYNPETGIMRRKTTDKGYHAGDIVGTPIGRGYIQAEVDGQRVLVHRLAWLYMTGAWPTKTINHKNGNHRDNSFSNLRQASRSEAAAAGRTGKRTGASGVLGVSWNKSAGKWHVQAWAKGKPYYGGLFESLDEASQKAANLRKTIHGEFANHV
jgi:HNH endonuclease